MEGTVNTFTVLDSLEDWRGLLGRHIGQALQILRKLLVGRLVVTPEGDHAEVAGTGTLGPFLSGVILPKGMASPTGTDTLWKGESRGFVRAA